ELFGWDENGNKRRKQRVLPDGARLHFPYIADHVGFRPTFADGSVDHTHPCRPGFRFADIDDTTKRAADAAYEARRERLSNAWRTKDDVKAEANRDGTPPHTRSLDQLRAAADAAYHDRSE